MAVAWLDHFQDHGVRSRRLDLDRHSAGALDDEESRSKGDSQQGQDHEERGPSDPRFFSFVEVQHIDFVS